QGPGGDAAVIRLPETDTAVAITVDGPGRYCYLDPYEGARLAVAEAARNVAATGARPLAVTNCLNFGNPEKPEVMWQFSEVVRGLRDACLALETPVTGGNVSFYNETNDRPIYPTPVIGMLGVLDSPQSNVGLAFRDDGDLIVLLGTTSPDDFGGSEYAKVVNATIAGPPPALDIDAEKAVHALLHEAAAERLLRSSHDLSSGGLAITLAESAIAGRRGFRIEALGYRALFSETPGRCVVSVAAAERDRLFELAARHDVAAVGLGSVGGTNLDFGDCLVSLEEAVDAFEGVLPRTLSTSMATS
ncbi:MAG: phosphoribosylformylglycinamidine synthase II, partial [Actinobacteria bacterium]|nr:phosphoribosylformylglycinamidine synthase II [Actinomycetota bacterium]